MSIKNRVKELFSLIEKFNDAMQSILNDCLDQAHKGNMNWFTEDFLPIWFASKHANAVNNHALRQWFALSGLELKFEKGTYKGLVKSQGVWGKDCDISERMELVEYAKSIQWYTLGSKENTTFKLPEVSLKGIATTLARVETFDNDFDLERYIRDLKSEFKQARVKASVWHSEHESDIERELEKMERNSTTEQTRNIEEGISNIRIIEPVQKKELPKLRPLSPAVRNILREKGFNFEDPTAIEALNNIQGTGKNGSFTKNDIDPLKVFCKAA